MHVTYDTCNEYAAARKSAPRLVVHRAMKEYYCFCFSAQVFDWKMGCHASYLSGGSGASPLSLPPLSSFLQSLPLIGRDSHHMCGGKVMGGMAALISERLPADKANGCGEAWASALPCNKHFHFVWLEWRMEWWKWWIWTTWGTEEGGGADR